MASILGIFDWLDGFIDLFQQFVVSKAVLAPLLLLLVEEAGIPIPVPGDILIAYTGYQIEIQPNSPALWEAFLAAQIAALLGATILYYLSRRWGQQLILKIGKFIFLKEEHIRKAEKLFSRFGVLTIIVGRHIPGLRIPVTIFAATSGVRYLVFIGSTFVSTSVWIVFYLIAGRRLGASFHTQAQSYAGISLAVIIGLTVGIFLIHLVGMYRESHRSQSKPPTA